MRTRCGEAMRSGSSSFVLVSAVETWSGRRRSPTLLEATISLVLGVAILGAAWLVRSDRPTPVYIAPQLASVDLLVDEPGVAAEAVLEYRLDSLLNALSLGGSTVTFATAFTGAPVVHLHLYVSLGLMPRRAGPR